MGYTVVSAKAVKAHMQAKTGKEKKRHMKIVTIAGPCQTVYEVHTNCGELLRSLRLQFGRYLLEGGNSSGLRIDAVKEGSLYRVGFGGEERETDRPLLEIDDIFFTHTRYDEKVFAAHGAALEWKGKAYLFLAATTSGKTTLAAYLVSRGLGYITDDCILIERETRRVIPYCMPMHLRQGGLEVLRGRGFLRRELPYMEEGGNRRYAYMPENCVEQPLPLEKIFFITRTEGENSLLPMGVNEKTAELMRSPITEYAVTGEYIRFLSRLARETECFRLRYADLEFAAEVVENG